MAILQAWLRILNTGLRRTIEEEIQLAVRAGLELRLSENRSATLLEKRLAEAFNASIEVSSTDFDQIANAVKHIYFILMKRRL